VSAPSPLDQAGGPAPELPVRRLDPTALTGHIQALNRVARSLWRTRDDADDLVKTPWQGCWGGRACFVASAIAATCCARCGTLMSTGIAPLCGNRRPSRCSTASQGRVRPLRSTRAS
jgi:hypothetical protein